MARAVKPKPITARELNELIAQARADRRTSFNLSRNNTGDEGAKAIAASLPGLTSLNLSGNNIGHEGAKAIAASLRGLTSLNLWDNNVGDEGVKAIATSLPGLISLDLSSNKIGDEGAKAIAASLGGLTSLELTNNNIGDEGAKAIAASLGRLTKLYLGDNIGDEGAKAIAASLPGLTSLCLFRNVGYEGAKAIAASLGRLTSLVLCGNIGAEGAKAIAASLRDLTSLHLTRTNIGDEGAKAIAASLRHLTSLHLTGNNIGDEGAKTIAASLGRLTSLNLWDNNIGDESAKAIAASLGRLTSLDLWDNDIGDEGAKAIAASLGRLTSLNLWDNNIGDEGAKAIAASLPVLTRLDLNNNNISAEGAKAILDAWSSEPKSNRLRYLDLKSNDRIGGLLPKEVLDTTDAQAILAAYRRFAVAQQQQTLRPLNEVKLLVVGNEAVGKTSLLRFLMTGAPRNPSETKTAGIVQHERIEVTPDWSPQGCQVRLNVWDFGGQEMMRGTHRFFLTERSLYLLVLEDRYEDDRRSVNDWMKTIRNRGGNSPVIIVINKSDAGKQHLRLDETGLQETYPHIAAFLRTSCDPDDWAKESIAKLRLKIVDIITASDHLKHIRDPIPDNWLRIKNRVSDLARKRSVLAHAEFIALCKSRGRGVEPVTDENEQRALLRLLHDLGVVIAHGLERDAPAARREISLLDPNWLTGAIYRVLDKASSVDQEGEFLRRQLGDWLDPQLYPPERHEFVLDMMQDKDVGLCFRLPVPNEQRFLVPEALPASRRFVGTWPEDSLLFRYTYKYLPPSLIPRFIVQSHRYLTAEKARWRTGVVLKVRDCEVLILADRDRQRIDIQVAGAPALRRAALNVVLDHLEAVHDLNPEAGPDAVVPLPDKPEVHVSYRHLLNLEEKKVPTHFPDGADREYLVAELLDGVRREQQDKYANDRDGSRAKIHPHFDITAETVSITAGDQSPIGVNKVQGGTAVQPVTPQEQNRHLYTLLAWGSGMLFLVALLAISLIWPDPTPFQLRVQVSILALAAAGFATVISGLLNITTHLGRQVVIGATGALAVLVLFYLWNPAVLQ